MTIDLHTHSTASDGTDRPAELVAAAAAAGVSVLGLTDHDSTAGWAEASAALPSGMTLVPGLEISCVWDGAGGRIGLHLLGYLPDPDDATLTGALAALRESRLHRGAAIVDLMAADGLPITWDQVERFADGGTVGRPHIARALVESGVVGSVTEAFAELLNSRAQYYVRKHDIPVCEAITLVLGAGGVPAFAHPLARRRGPVLDDDQIAALAEAGLLGIEVDHPDHDAADRVHLAGIAAELELIALGSSDYHGTNKLTPLAECTSSPQALAALIARAANPVVAG
ncbi:MAG: PHP domain-containing protein [Jatrophihabitans sp.]